MGAVSSSVALVFPDALAGQTVGPPRSAHAQSDDVGPVIEFGSMLGSALLAGESSGPDGETDPSGTIPRGDRVVADEEDSSDALADPLGAGAAAVVLADPFANSEGLRILGPGSRLEGQTESGRTLESTGEPIDAANEPWVDAGQSGHPPGQAANPGTGGVIRSVPTLPGFEGGRFGEATLGLPPRPKTAFPEAAEGIGRAAGPELASSLTGTAALRASLQAQVGGEAPDPPPEGESHVKPSELAGERPPGFEVSVVLPRGTAEPASASSGVGWAADDRLQRAGADRGHATESPLEADPSAPSRLLPDPSGDPLGPPGGSESLQGAVAALSGESDETRGVGASQVDGRRRTPQGDVRAEHLAGTLGPLTQDVADGGTAGGGADTASSHRRHRARSAEAALHEAVGQFPSTAPAQRFDPPPQAPERHLALEHVDQPNYESISRMAGSPSQDGATPGANFIGWTGSDAFPAPEVGPGGHNHFTSLLGRAGAYTDTADLTRQVVRAMYMQWRDGAGQAHVQLHPEHLGHLTLSLTVEHGVVVAAVVAESDRVRQWIEGQREQLQQSLGEQGLKLDRFLVTTATDGRREAEHGPGSGQGGRRQRRPARRSAHGAFEILV